jgi:hypothetical protein
MDEFGNPGEPVEDTQTTHYVKSSVLGGATIVELNGSEVSDTVNIYAGRQRIARDESGSVVFEHRNPVTGSWAVSLGHSSYRTTRREERDPRGAELPTSNPYAYAWGYVGMKFGEPLFIEGGDPFDFASGRMIDGMPVSEAEFQRRLDHGSATAEKIDAFGNRFIATNTVNFGGSVWVDEWSLAHSVSGDDFLMNVNADGSVSMPTDESGQPTGVVPTVTIKATKGGYFITASDGPKSRNHPAQTRSNPQNTLDDLLQQGRTELISRINEQKACADVFGGREKALKALNQLKFKPGSLDNGGIMEIKGNNVTVDTSRFTESGQTLALALNISKSTVQGHPSTRYDLMSLKLSGKEFAAFAIGHELGHKRKIYGEYNNDGSSAFSNLEAGANNEKIRAACFSEFAPQPIR